MLQVQIFYSPPLRKIARSYEPTLRQILGEQGIPEQELRNDDSSADYRVIFDPGNYEKAQSLVERVNRLSGLCAKIVPNGKSS